MANWVINNKSASNIYEVESLDSIPNLSMKYHYGDGKYASKYRVELANPKLDPDKVISIPADTVKSEFTLSSGQLLAVNYKGLKLDIIYMDTIPPKGMKTRNIDGVDLFNPLVSDKDWAIHTYSSSNVDPVDVRINVYLDDAKTATPFTIRVKYVKDDFIDLQNLINNVLPTYMRKYRT